jgi:hypothetical protein
LHSSLRDPDGSATDQWTWDGFTIAWTQVITEVQWRGAANETPAEVLGGVQTYDYHYVLPARTRTCARVTAAVDPQPGGARQVLAQAKPARVIIT